ncbi:MAG: nitroreductase family protein [Clostridia bacterium]|nr:NAD(P)H nitroreductase [Oscillospiraceae bacterium]MBQ6701513.1 nitroreductase family protein [Clostridia bacterium]
MDAIKCLLERRSIRSFTDRKIEKNDLETIVKAAYHAPSAMNRQLCRFTVVQNAEVIEALAQCLRVKLGRDEGYCFYRPNAVILCSTPRDNAHGIEDCAVAMENIMLAAHALGIGSVWINQFKGVCDDPGVRAELNKIGVPENNLVWGMAALGYAADDAVRNFDKNPDVVNWVM